MEVAEVFVAERRAAAAEAVGLDVTTLEGRLFWLVDDGAALECVCVGHDVPTPPLG
jgi:hypothetical protein